MKKKINVNILLVLTVFIFFACEKQEQNYSTINVKFSDPSMPELNEVIGKDYYDLLYGYKNHTDTFLVFVINQPKTVPYTEVSWHMTISINENVFNGPGIYDLTDGFAKGDCGLEFMSVDTEKNTGTLFRTNNNYKNNNFKLIQNNETSYLLVIDNVKADGFVGEGSALINALFYIKADQINRTYVHQPKKKNINGL